MAQNTSSLNVVGQGACRHLLSKGMFLTGSLEPTEHPLTPHADGYCWCNLTQGQMGPDNRVVDRPDCQAGRSCYEPR
jgi:hypothetical protein